MEEITPIPEHIEKPTRPQFLTILCVLTFIASAVGIIFCLILIFSGEYLKDFIESSPDMPEEAMGNTEILANRGFWLISLLLVSVSLFGAIKMFQLKKIGFHLYAIANILAIIIPLLYGNEFSTGGLIITAAFIAMYASNLKYMS